MGKRPRFLRSSSYKRTKDPAKDEMQRPLSLAGNAGTAAGGKGKRKTGSRLWMRFDPMGQSELLECDKATIMRRVKIPARDLRILGPVFSTTSNILARERAMVVNLEFVKVIVTAEEVLLLDPLSQEVLPFVDQLRRLLPPKTITGVPCSGAEQCLNNPEAADVLEPELPFEFQVLEIALEVVCTQLDSNVSELEREAYPLLDELARNVNTKSLERVRSLKSILTRLLSRVQKVRDELEHLLDDNEDMAHLYLTRRHVQSQRLEGSALGNRSNSLGITSHLHRVGSNSRNNGSISSSFRHDDHDVEDLEMLLEAYFMQLEGTRNKILSVREYIDDTEDYVNIQLDNQRNELIQLQLILTIGSFAIAADTLVVSIFGMNIPCTLYSINGLFWPLVLGTLVATVILFLLIVGYSRWKRLIGV